MLVSAVQQTESALCIHIFPPPQTSLLPHPCPTPHPTHLCVCQLLSGAKLFAAPWTAAHQAPLSMGFLRQRYWRGFPYASPRDLPDSGIEPGSPALQADSSPTELPGKPHPSSSSNQCMKSLLLKKKCQNVMIGFIEGFFFFWIPRVQELLASSVSFRPKGYCYRALVQSLSGV